MTEFHAYLNKDGTYRLEVPTQIGDLKGKTIVPRAKLTIECLTYFDEGYSYISTFIEDED
jgi:hypothetical protein